MVIGSASEAEVRAPLGAVDAGMSTRLTPAPCDSIAGKPGKLA
jgi:hypothetical protein